MDYYRVSPLRVIGGKDDSLTYHGPSGVQIGSIIAIPFGTRTAIGIVLGMVAKPDFATKPIGQKIEDGTVLKTLLLLHEWIMTYYAARSTVVWQTMLPAGLGKKRKNSLPPLLSHTRNRTKIVLNKHQSSAVNKVLCRPEGTTLLHGVTGSGKTQVYIELAQRTISEGKSVIFLVPEIALTSQIIAELQPYFPQLVVVHSKQTEAQRHTIWRSLLASKKPSIVIGPRSALFSPLHTIGLIVIDECHEPSFKQEQSPRYSALRVASKLAELHHARLVLGSATPSVADYYLANQTQTPIAEMPRPARPNTIKPNVMLIDMTKKTYFTRHTYLSNPLLEKIQQTLAAGQQTLIFHNRRGSAPTTLCEHCGWSAACPRCFIPLTLHADRYILRCHVCNYTERVPTACPACGNASVIHKGIGTKRIETDLKRLFPTARIARFDGDSEATETVDASYQKIYDGDIDIIVGTQVVAKGLDLPKLRTVGVVQADSGLSLPDYQSPERVFQLLAQVSGRVGRNEHPSDVVVQSYQPTSPSVQFGIHQDYAGFYESAINERKQALFPPFTFLLKLTCIYKTEAAAIRAAQQLARTLTPLLPEGAKIFGPTPAFYERSRDTYRWQIIVKSPSRSGLLNLIIHVPPAHWQFDIDPANLL